MIVFKQVVREKGLLKAYFEGWYFLGIPVFVKQVTPWRFKLK